MSNIRKPALNVSQRALSLQPTNPFAILAVAEALHCLKRIEEALLDYQDIAADPRLSVAARRGILECVLELKQWNRILELLEQWGVPPEKSYRWRVPALAGQQRLDEAMAACRQWLKSRPVPVPHQLIPKHSRRLRTGRVSICATSVV